ncbi:response regulator [Vibrio profundum]|uniref:response regulator n=1 Tax=Vibrio profundum TaxID=2910247 RepID=UPI003D115628
MKKKVLVIDDSELCLAVIDALIRESHLSDLVAITCCQDPIAAKDMLAKKPFDLVITDLVMPNIDGYEMITKAREVGAMPIIAVSSGYGIGDETSVLDEAKILGADETLIKNRLQQDLIHTIDKYIRVAA